MRPVEWTVITEENMDAKFEEWNTLGKPFALFVLSGEGYENLGLNISDIRALLQQQQQIIAAYESYYKSDDDSVTSEE